MTEAKQDLRHGDLQHTAWRQCEKIITFDGGTTNAIGDENGTNDPFDIFTVTGTIRTRVFAICTTDLVGASATLEIGVAGGTAKIIALTTATTIDESEIWHDASSDSPVEANTVVVENIVANSLNIRGEVKTANITAGVIKFICLWRPVSDDGNVTPA